MRTRLLAALVFMLSLQLSVAQGDTCATATPITVGASCTFTTYTNATATDSGAGNPGCAFYVGADVWFSVTVPAGGSLIIDSDTGVITDSGMAIYSGTCGSLTLIECDDDDSANGLMSRIDATGLTPGSTIYIRFWEFGGDNNGTFDLCVTQPPPPPPNDECSSAIGLSVNPDQSCTSVTSGTIESATDSGVTASGCFGSDDDDVWYSFVATGPTHTIDLLNVSGSTTDLYHAVYAGTCAAPGAAILCSDPNSSTVTGLTAGNTYYLQVYTWTASPGQNTVFDICIGTPLPPPSNDDCSGATSVGVNPDQSCTVTASGTIESATDSGVTASGCFGTDDDDVWFSFVATGTTHTIDLLNVTGSTTDLYHAVYAGTCAAPGAAILCSDPNNSIVGGLTAGNTYFVQVYSWTSVTGQDTTFDICVGTPPPPPPNDLCANAEVISCSTSGLAGYTTGASNQVHGTGCTMSNYGVWYTFTGDGNEWTISTTAAAGYDHEMALVEGTCGSFTNIGCEDSALAGGTESQTVLTTIGQTYYVYVAYWLSSGTATDTGNFTLDVTCTPPCTIGSPVTTTVGCPSVDAGGLGLNGADPAPIICNSGSSCVDLEATYLQVGETTDYYVEQIQYNPPVPIGVLANPISVNQDDVWSPVINLPFTFCFYGNTYSSVIIGSNGIVNFNTAAAGAGAGYIINDDLPSTNGDLFPNCIYGVYHDIDPSLGGNVSWELVNLPTGCRALVAAWHDVPMFYNGNFGNGAKLYSGMIVLYEDTNVIEVYIENKEVDDNNWNDGNAIVGIQNSTATQAVVAPCRNALDTNWTSTNEAWRFVPDGNQITSITWYEGSGTSGPVIGTTDVINVCPGATTTYTAEVTYNLCNNPTPLVVTEETTVTVNGNKLWIGGNAAGPDDWNVGANWSPAGVPTSGDCVVIQNVATQPVFADPGIPLPINPGFGLNLTVESGATLEVTSDSGLEITDFVNVQPTAEFTIRDGGSLVQINDSAVNIGDIKVERTVSNLNPEDYVYWSSPVNGFSVTDISPGTNLGFIWQWIPTIGNNYGDWQNTAENMIPGKGYIVRDVIGTPTADTPVFEGVARNGIISRTIQRGTYTGADYSGPGDTDVTALDDNWNLVGNPYPSALSYSSFISANPEIDGTIYLWTHQSAPSNAVNSPFYNDFLYNYNPNDYITNNFTGPNPPGFNGSIASGQAFFVLMLDNATQTESITFNNSMRAVALDNTVFYGAPGESNALNANDEPERHRIWLDLISPDLLATSILVGYVEGATNDNDRLYDGYYFPGNSLGLYSIVSETPYSIQGRALPFNEEDIIPLGVKIPVSETYQIGINSVDGLFSNNTQDIFIEDIYNNLIHNLSESPYSFYSENGNFEDRFILRFTDDTLSDEEFTIDDELTILSFDDKIKITSSRISIENVTIYDLLGRVVYSEEKLNTMQHIINSERMARSAYFVEVTLSNGLGKIKKIVN